MLGDMSTRRIAGNIVEGIVLEEIVPEDEGWCQFGGFHVVIPSVQHSNDLIALLSEVLFWEEQELGLSVDVNEHIFSFLDERVSTDTNDVIEYFLKCELFFGR